MCLVDCQSALSFISQRFYFQEILRQVRHLLRNLGGRAQISKTSLNLTQRWVFFFLKFLFIYFKSFLEAQFWWDESNSSQVQKPTEATVQVQ